jgi:hypothetical protein
MFEKSKNILLCSLFSSVLASKIKNPKIFVVLLRFCKVCCRVQSHVAPLELGIHFILFKLHKWKKIMMTYDNRDVVRGWYELYLFSFLYIYSSMWTCLVGSCEVYVI